jgi:hypothetical protein
MRIKCVTVGGMGLLAADVTAGNTRISVFHVAVGRIYNVYGLLFANAVLSYLIVDDAGSPSWYPGSLFQIVDGRVSRHWCFVNWSREGGYFSA